VIQHAIMKDGVRRVTHIAEVAGVSQDQVILQGLFEHRLGGYAADGRAVGGFVASGARPKFFEKLKLAVGQAKTEELLAAGMA
jgi:pilus assembly protein CpaF